MSALGAIAARGGGLGRAAAALEGAVSGGRLGHATILVGPTGAGKRELARALAAVLLPRMRADGTHPDLVVLAPLEGKREIGIDQVREALAELALSPLEGPRRVAIVEGADLLGEEAANALLKTLEEPPEGVTLVLTTARPEAVLPTIRSRCIAVRLPSPAAAAEAPAYAGALARALVEEVAAGASDPFDWAARCFGACEEAAQEGAGEAGTPLEKKRRAVLAVIDAALGLVGERFRGRARAGEPTLAEAAAVERLAAAAEHIEANVTPLLALETLALDLGEAGAG